MLEFYPCTGMVIPLCRRNNLAKYQAIEAYDYFLLKISVQSFSSPVSKSNKKLLAHKPPA